MVTTTADPRVSFLVAGVQKAGTTALFDHLRAHPGLCLPAGKECHFFDDERVDWRRPDYRPYEALFEGCGARRCGEATPIYLYWPASLERIRTYNPAMRLILLFRDPVARAWSHWRMERGRGTETAPFSWCIRQGRHRLADPARLSRDHSYVERGFYGAQLARCLALFPRDQLLLLTSADLAERPAALLARVWDFLGIERIPAGAPRRGNVGPVAGEPLAPADVEHLRAVYAEDQALFRRLSGLPASW